MEAFGSLPVVRWSASLAPRDTVVRRSAARMVPRRALALSLLALHCAAGYKTGKVVSCNA